MFLSLTIILIAGLILAKIAEILKLPRLVGMLVAGIIIGPYTLNLLDEKILTLSADIRKIALIIILIKAGLTLTLKDLKKVGRPAIFLSFLPATFEIIGYTLFAPILFGITRAEAAVMGAVLAAVSPAVVVPRMVHLIETKWGTKKGIPQMILAGASLDDIFVIVLFTSFLGIAQGENLTAGQFLEIPVSIILGTALGIASGLILFMLFKKLSPTSELQAIIILATAFLLIGIEQLLENTIAISALLAIIAMAGTIKHKYDNQSKEESKSTAQEPATKLATIFGKLWIPAEIFLFVLVGAAVDIRYTVKAGKLAIFIIAITLIFRIVGVMLSTIKSNLSSKEKIFTALAYLPKATVQAAIGSIPLSAGLPAGDLILSVAVLAILITAPLGAIAIDKSYTKLLSQDESKESS